jgi:nucleotide-binding universal stress UspA family protein
MALKFPRILPWSQAPDSPDPRTFAPASVLLASEGRRFPAEAVEFAVELSRGSKAPVLVLMIARIWGSAFGLPHPNLMPTKNEWQARRDAVAEAVDHLRRRGVEARGKVVSSRNAAKRILAETKNRRPGDCIVMAAPAPRHWFIANFLWEHEPYRVRRLAKSPVYLLVDGQSTALGDTASAATGGTEGLAFARPISKK